MLFLKIVHSVTKLHLIQITDYEADILCARQERIPSSSVAALLYCFKYN